MPSARAPLSSLTPRARNSSSSTAATSASFSGSTCWRDTTSDTFEPSALNMWVNSTPVTPEPMTHRCSGISARRVRLAGGEDRARRRPPPSRGRVAASRSRATTKSASSCSMPVVGLGDHLVRALAAGRCRAISRTPCDSSSVPHRRRAGGPRSTPPARAARRRRGGPRPPRPIARARVSSESSPPVAIIAFDGMQSQRCAAPPMMSRSMSVTSAPSVAATVAAVLPPGPPPMITRRTGIGPGYATRCFGNVPPDARAPVTTRSADAAVIVAVERAARPVHRRADRRRAAATRTTARSVPATRR